jgi:prepilin-type N-terminal cleavage/methylation domain-containing protein
MDMCRQCEVYLKGPKAENGFTLVELLIAIGIFSIGILAVATLQVNTISGNNGARKIADVLVMAEDQVENFMTMPYNDAQLDPAANPQRVDTGGYSMVWNVAMADLNGNGTDDAKSISMTVSHLGDRKRSFTMQYIKPEP